LLSSCCCWRGATSRRLAPFSHCSASRIFIRQPGCIPSPMVTQEGDHWFDGGEKQAGLRPLPCPQLQGSSSSLQGRGVSRGLPSCGLASRFFLRHLGVETILQLCGGGILQPCEGRRTAAALPGCSISSSARATVGDRTRGSHNMSYAARAVLVFWDGPVLVFVARTGVRTCRCALGQPTLAGAVLVGRWTPPSVLRWWQPEKVSPQTRSLVPSALRASGSLALISGSRPPRGDANESLVVAASALRSSLLLFGRPERRSLSLLQRSAASHPGLVVSQALRCGGCSYPREWNRSSVCNGTLSAGVCSLWLSGPEHLGILGAMPCFFLISSTRTRLSAS
jgi:hypothetical protein